MATYVMSDLHGYMEIYKKVKAILNPEDTVYFLGDAGDRGPETWECIKTLISDPQFIYIKGNHEDMLVDAATDYLQGDERWEHRSWSLCARNGGSRTLDQWEADPYREEWLSRIRKLPTWDTYDTDDRTYIFTHAGFTPWKNDCEEVELPTDEDMMWNRDHWLDNPEDTEIDTDVVIIHGHTPIPYVAMDLNMEWEGGALWYDGSRKACIDSGGYFTREWILLNLDTLEEHIIKLDKENENANITE